MDFKSKMKIGFASLPLYVVVFTIFMIGASIPMLLGILQIVGVGQDLGNNLKSEVANNIRSTLTTILARSESITSLNANFFRNGMFRIPDQDEPRGPDLDTFNNQVRIQMYSFRICTAIHVTTWRGALFGVYANADYTTAGKWESYTNVTTGLPVLEDFETHVSGHPKEGDVVRLLSHTEPYNSSHQVWYTIVNTSLPNDSGWTPIYFFIAETGSSHMITHSTVARRPDGSLIGVTGIDIALGFFNTVLRRDNDTVAFVVDVLMEGGVVIGSSEAKVKLLECINATTVDMDGDQCVGGTQVFTKLSRAKSDYITGIDSLVKSTVGAWSSIHTDQAYTAKIDNVDVLVQMTVLKRNKLHWVVVVIPLPSIFDRLRWAVKLSSVGMGITFSLIVVLCIGLFFALLKYMKARTRDVSKAPKGHKVAIMFTDVQNSTKLWNTNKKAMEKAIDAHHTTIRDIVSKHDGYEVKTIGDSFMVAHDDPTVLLRIALECQKKLLTVAWPDEILQFEDASMLQEGTKLIFRGLRIRVGLHYGEANHLYDEVAKGYDYYGDTVNCAARLESVAWGGQILCTNSFLAEIDATLKAELQTTYMGRISLKGIAEPVAITEVKVPDLLERAFDGIRDPSDLTTTQTGDRHKTNLPLVMRRNSATHQKDVDQLGLIEAREEISRLRSIVAAREFELSDLQNPKNLASQPKKEDK